MAQKIKVIAAKLDDLRSIPGAHMVEGMDYHKLSFDLHRPAGGLCDTPQ